MIFVSASLNNNSILVNVHVKNITVFIYLYSIQISEIITKVIAKMNDQKLFAVRIRNIAHIRNKRIANK